MWPLLSLALAASPPPQPAGPLPEIPAPLGHLAGVVTPVPADLTPSDRPVQLAPPGCEPQVVWLMRALGGTIRAVEQLQQWLDRAGLEKVLFKRKGVLGDVVHTLADARFEARTACPAPKLDGFRLELTEVPAKFCEAKDAAGPGETWFFSKDRPAAVVHVTAGQAEACAPRISVVLFDSHGVARLRLHQDFGGVMSANLLGDSCRSVDFDFVPERAAFKPTWKSCKR